VVVNENGRRPERLEYRMDMGGIKTDKMLYPPYTCFSMEKNGKTKTNQYDM
jgi:hypothetical protein